jgi:site-specific DNA-methyltransferase (adenine-specific)
LVNLIKGDCLEKYKEIEPGSVDLILTDLPYGIMHDRPKPDYKQIIWDKIIPMNDLWPVMKCILRPNGRIILFAKQPFTTQIINTCPKSMKLCYTCIWEKNRSGMHFNSKRAPLNMYEEILVFRAKNGKRKGTFNLWDGKPMKSNIFKYNAVCTNNFHPTQKPVLLLQDLIKTYTNPGDLVVDLTMGSGSTGVACQITKRDFIGIEIDERFFRIAESRIGEAGRSLFDIFLEDK